MNRIRNENKDVRKCLVRDVASNVFHSRTRRAQEA